MLVIALMGFSTSAFALFCPNNFNQINIGDTIEQINSQCGKPDFQKSEKVEDDNGPQEWNFYVNPSANPGYKAPTATYGQQASLQMTIAMNEGKVVNITVNGMSLASTTICGGSVTVGDSKDKVKKACGTPKFVNKSSVGNDAPAVKKTTYKYNSNPPVELIFENGKLTERQ